MTNKVYSGKYTDSGTGHSPYAGGESGGGKGNPLSDSCLMKPQSGYGKAYGSYESFSIGQRLGYKKPRPSVQNHGKDEN